MCGLAGWITNEPNDPGLLNTILSTIAYRGPDARGVWFDRQNRVG